MPGTEKAAAFAERLRANNVNVVGLEMEVAGPLGSRRYDIVIRDAQGKLQGIEIKSGSATKTPYQDFTDRYVNEFGAKGLGRIKGETVYGSSTVYVP